MRGELVIVGVVWLRQPGAPGNFVCGFHLARRLWRRLDNWEERVVVSIVFAFSIGVTAAPQQAQKLSAVRRQSVQAAIKQ